MTRPDESVGPTVSLQAIDEVSWLGLKVTILKAALELDVFSAIAEGHQSVTAIADTLQCSHYGMTVLLNALCPLGLLTKADGRYHLTPPSESFLLRGKPAFCAPIFLAWLRSREHFTECVRLGKAVADHTASEAEELWVGYASSYLLTWQEQAQVMRERWAASGITRTALSGARVLDLGCGPGVKSFVLAQDDPGTQITAVDRPRVLAVSEQIADLMGIKGQVRFQAGDASMLELDPNQFDLALLGNLLHYFNPAKVDQILRRVEQSLVADGWVVIDAGLPDEETCQREQPLMLAVEMLSVAVEGKIYTFPEYRGLLEQAGFSEVTHPHERLVVGRKRYIHTRLS